jgi:hypothetical protein
MSDSASSFLSLGMYMYSASPRMIAALGLMFGPLAIGESTYSVPIVDRPPIGKNYRALSLNFESNQGQTDPSRSR